MTRKIRKENPAGSEPPGAETGSPAPSIRSELSEIWNQIFPASHLGKQGEKAAERFLRRRGMRIIERGYSNHVGEIDLIAVEKKQTVVFVEVKTRRSDDKGMPVEAVDDRKQRQIVQTALVYLRQNHLLESPFRFDIVGILWPDSSKKPQIAHYIGAFEPAGQGQMFT